MLIDFSPKTSLFLTKESQPQASSNHIHIRLVDHLLPATACARIWVPLSTALQKKFRSGTLPPAAPQKQYRRDVCMFCRDSAYEMLTCSFLLCNLSERDRAVPDAGAHLQVQTSTAVASFHEIWVARTEVCRFFVHQIRKEISSGFLTY